MLRIPLAMAASLAMSLSSIPPVVAQVNYSQYVNPFIGGSGPFPGQACKYPPSTATALSCPVTDGETAHQLEAATSSSVVSGNSESSSLA